MVSFMAFISTLNNLSSSGHGHFFHHYFLTTVAVAITNLLKQQSSHLSLILLYISYYILFPFSPGACRTNILKRPGLLGPGLDEDVLFGMEEKSSILGGVLVEKQDVVDAILFLASDSARTITGSNLCLDRGAVLAGPPPMS